MTYTTDSMADVNAFMDMLRRQRYDLWSRNPGLSEGERNDLGNQHGGEAFDGFIDDGSAPRSLQLEDSGLDRATLAIDIPGALQHRHSATSIPSAVSMARSTSSRSSKSHQLHAMSASPSASSIPAKRAHDQFDSTYPATHTYSLSTAPRLLQINERPTGARIMDPLEYICGAEYSSISDKRLRTDEFDSFSLSLHALYPRDALTGTSLSNSLSPSVFTTTSASEPMSRQSSVLTAPSIAGGVGLLRIDSSRSSCSETPFFPFDAELQQCNSVVSSSETEVPSSSDPTTTTLEYNDFMSSVGNFPVFFSNSFPPTNAEVLAWAGANEHLASVDGTANMLRSESEQSNNSSSVSSTSDVKATERLQKHIRNGQRQIASKGSSLGSTTVLNSTKDSKVRLIRPQESGAKRKELIAKQQSYTRPQHPKLMCEFCNEKPDGYRGEHELRRHFDRMHAETRKVWICVDEYPDMPKDHMPARPLDICRQCKQHKSYNVDYNAAAHLRRAHFFPRKRGRRARGEKPEKRAGKTGGNTPSIEWLRAHGFLKQIEIRPSELSATASMDNEDEEYDDLDCEPVGGNGYEQQAENLFPPAEFNFNEFPDYSFPTAPSHFSDPCDVNDNSNCVPPHWHPTMDLSAAPPMQQSISAPAAMMMTTMTMDMNEFGSGIYTTTTTAPDGFEFELAVDASLSFGQ